MLVKCIYPFFDLKEDTRRDIGETFDVTLERYEEILSKGNFIEKAEEEIQKDLTKEEIKKLLEEKNIEYNKSATKNELKEILDGAK